MLLAEAAAALPRLRQYATTAAGEEGVREVIGRRFALYPQPKRTDAEWAMWWTDYFDVLSGIPRCALEAGMAAWIAEPTSEFLPKPGRLRELALNGHDPVFQAIDRARAAGAWRPPFQGPLMPALPPTPRGIPEPPQADKDRVMALARSFRADVEANRPKPVEGPPTHGATDEKGVTPELRALLARQRG